jgi:hypothetical protein
MQPLWKGSGVGFMNKVIIVLACILLRAPGTLCQEQSVHIFSPPSCDDFHRCFTDLLFGVDRARNPSTVLPPPAPLRECFAIDLHMFAADDTETAGRSFSAARPQGKKPSRDHSYLIELSAANWHPLSHSEKLGLFQWDLLHWETHTSLALDAGLSLATNDRAFLGRGGYGFLRRYGFNMADEANYTFFGAFLFPTLFHEDPRYIPMDHGTKRARTAYALSRVILTRNDAGGSELNKSLILGTVVSSAISSAYYAPVGGTIGAGAIFANVGTGLASDAGFNLLKEYWPNVSRKLKLNLWIRNLIRSSVRDTVRIY